MCYYIYIPICRRRRHSLGLLQISYINGRALLGSHTCAQSETSTEIFRIHRFQCCVHSLSILPQTIQPTTRKSTLIHYNNLIRYRTTNINQRYQHQQRPLTSAQQMDQLIINPHFKQRFSRMHPVIIITTPTRVSTIQSSETSSSSSQRNHHYNRSCHHHNHQSEAHHTTSTHIGHYQKLKVTSTTKIHQTSSLLMVINSVQWFKFNGYNPHRHHTIT